MTASRQISLIDIYSVFFFAPYNETKNCRKGNLFENANMQIGGVILKLEKTA